MILVAAVLLIQTTTSAQVVRPVIEFPEPGIDDTAAYQGYRTRFFKDAAGNAVQIYLNQREGRVVHLWADAANASAGFTARDAEGRPARLAWGSAGVAVASSGPTRSVEYTLIAGAGPIEIGRFLLGSMRLERDFQYQRGHLQPFDAPGIDQPELVALIAHLERLDPGEQRRHLELLRATNLGELRSRLRPTIRQSGPEVRIEQRTFDGRNRLSMVLTIENGQLAVDSGRGSVTIRPAGSRAITLGIRITTDAAVLHPLAADQIFNADFLSFARRLQEARDPRFARVDRQIKSAGLVSYQEKLMAGLPNFATYFGRDMIMSALMLEPVWTHDMLEHVIASVLRKLTPDGQVSHEEALGGQAIRENAGEAMVLLAAAESARGRGDGTAADSLVGRARGVLRDLQRVRENYHMVDDDFQFPVLVARYLGNPAIPAERKRAFVRGTDGPGSTPRVVGLVRNLAYVARQASPYARSPVAGNLVSFARRSDGRWASSSWRDSNAGYAGGRYAMDVNVVWVPAALAATQTIVSELEGLGWTGEALAGMVPGALGAPLRAFVLEPGTLDSALAAWRGARRHFEVEVAPEEAAAKLARWLEGLPEAERGYWRRRIQEPPSPGALRFLALSADSAARPIPVMSTDPAMLFFLEDATGHGEAIADLQPFVLPYPQGLFVPGLGPLVANDAFAGAEIQQAFRDDQYHSPRVVWGREVNLLLLGLTRQLAAAYDSTGRLKHPALGAYATALVEALARILTAVEASGLKHNELWSYRIEGDRLQPVRYGTSSDIQLWNLTDLAVQYALARLPGPAAARFRQTKP